MRAQEFLIEGPINWIKNWRQNRQANEYDRAIDRRYEQRANKLLLLWRTWAKINGLDPNDPPPKDQFALFLQNHIDIDPNLLPSYQKEKNTLNPSTLKDTIIQADKEAWNAKNRAAIKSQPQPVQPQQTQPQPTVWKNNRTGKTTSTSSSNPSPGNVTGYMDKRWPGKDIFPRSGYVFRYMDRVEKHKKGRLEPTTSRIYYKDDRGVWTNSDGKIITKPESIRFLDSKLDTDTNTREIINPRNAFTTDNLPQTLTKSSRKENDKTNRRRKRI